MAIKITDYLGKDAEHPTSSTCLCDRLGITRQQLSLLVLQARRNGEAVSSNSGGYFIAQTKEEMLDLCGRLRHRAGEIFATRAACLKIAESLPSKEVI